MPRIVFSGDTQVAHLTCQMLLWNGIAARVIGDARSGLQGALPIPDLAVTVVVDDARDEERARALIAKVEADGGDCAGPAWICGRCAEENEPGFEICWSCRRPRDASAHLVEGGSPYRGARARHDDADAGVAAGATSKGVAALPARWGDLMFALVMAVAPATLARLAMSGPAPDGFRSAVAFAALSHMLTAVICGVPLALLARWRRGSLPLWGVVRPRWGADVVAGACLGLLLVLLDVILRPLLGFVGVLEATGTAGDWALLTAFAALSSVATGVVAFGVFFSGAERLLKSRAIAVVVAATVSTLMNQTCAATWAGSLVQAVLLALAFAKVRRIWPIAIASTLASLSLWHLTG